MNAVDPCLVLTAGEPAGIGPDIIIQYAQNHLSIPWLVIADKNLFQERAAQLKLPLHIHEYSVDSTVTLLPAGHIYILHTPLTTRCISGQLNPDNAAYVLRTLHMAVSGCLSGEFSGLVTAPVHKAVMNDAGIHFTGHTEYLAELTHSDTVVMVLATPGLRVALATTHLPLAQVSAAITATLLENILRVLHQDLQTKLGIAQPRIAVCGLNPHAGEAGHLGHEEIEVIIPVLSKLRREGFRLQGPLPADTAFVPAILQQTDAYLAMYHDQGLPVLKYAGFGQAVNITLGLPFIRTSVDHGTALELAGSGKAEINSLVYAIDVANEMIGNKAMYPLI